MSVSQLKLAIINGDPNLVARCGLFMVFSYCQRGLKHKAKRLIKYSVYPYISKINYDNILKNMYKAACYRVKILFQR